MDLALRAFIPPEARHGISQRDSNIVRDMIASKQVQLYIYKYKAMASKLSVNLDNRDVV